MKHTEAYCYLELAKKSLCSQHKKDNCKGCPAYRFEFFNENWCIFSMLMPSFEEYDE